MIISEIELFEILSQHMGPDKAKALVHFVEAKVDRRLEENTRLFSTKEDIANLRTEVSQEIARLRTEVNQEIASLRTEVRTEIAQAKVDILRWLVATGIALAGVVVAAAKFL